MKARRVKTPLMDAVRRSLRARGYEMTRVPWAADCKVVALYGGVPVGEFKLTELPGSCVWSSGAKVYPEHRSCGHGRALLAARLSACKAAGLRTFVAVVRKDNIVERRLLAEVGGVEADAGRRVVVVVNIEGAADA